jgi:pimeloyl-ACP methyl ester carboxylesterase
MSTKVPTAEQMKAIKQLARFNSVGMRVPIVRKPSDYDMSFEELTIPSYDNVPLKAWYIPYSNSNKLIICNHPAPMNRYGFPGHMDEYSSISNFEVNFMPEYKALHEAGYNILTYDLRNMGESGEGDGGSCGIGRYEWKDCVGVKKYVDSHREFSKMTVGLLSRCTGANAQYEAISRYPQLFENVNAMVNPQPISMIRSATYFASAYGVGEFMDVLDREQCHLGGFPNHAMSPHFFAPDVKIPTLVSQVHDDLWTKPEDAQTTFDLLGSKEKDLLWIHGTDRRFDGYNYFGQHPERMLEWFNKYMGKVNVHSTDAELSIR